ncbi:MAG: TlpA family protein disulfide reductase [Clostridia bacterium]|nr:TlpA family protein disulfide reductase [Clostridia bacterium]
MRRFLCILVFLTLLYTGGFAERWDEVVGQTAPDFEAVCADGSIYHLYDALSEKRLAVVCVFGSGCGACRKELHALEMAYRLYGEDVSVIALSLDRTYDTDEVLLAFAAEQGITFPLARDPARTARFMQINMYPAWMLLDANATVLAIEVNGPASIDHFAEVFDSFLGNSQNDSEVLCEGESCLIPEE